ncbi:MAG: ATP-binding protein [Deltaproteobacteria bacterium]|nr:hypothetical protein [Myxococcales bacterium]MDP3217092.1 ATP-binding protein [Deltaproteobacteria bacterium]
MPRHFNTAGPCRAELHYMLPPERRVPEVRALVETQAYFALHAPRQVGKTTALTALAASLTREGRYAAVMVSMETGAPFSADVGAAEDAILDGWRHAATFALPPELRPPAWPAAAPGGRIQAALSAWTTACPRPLVVFIDEVDALRDQALVSVLRQMRAGHNYRPTALPWSLALVGLRDVRDYKVASGGADRLNTASPFNIKVESLTMRDFTAEEVGELYAQHTADTGQPFEADAVARAFELTRGQPWLVNALAYVITTKLVGDRTQAVTVAHVDRARDELIERQDTHLDSLAERLRDPRVRAVVEPMIQGAPLASLAPDDLRFAIDLGLVRRDGDGTVEVANPIYREIIVRSLTDAMRASIPKFAPTWLGPEGAVDWQRLREAFVAFWLQHGEALRGASAYPEAAPHLVLMAFLHRVVNGGGRVERELALGSGRLDLGVEVHGERLGIEVKTWRDADKSRDPTVAGLAQLEEYLARFGTTRGWLVLFDQRSGQPDLPERISVEARVTANGREISVIRL